MSATLEHLAQLGGATVHGDGSCTISAVNTLQLAQAGDISFIGHQRYRNFLTTTKASAVILTEADLPLCPTHALVTDNPYLTYAKIANHLYPKPAAKSRRGNDITIGEHCQIDATVDISSQVVIGDHVKIGAGTTIGAATVIEDHVTIGHNSSVAAHVTVCHGSQMGNNVMLAPGVVIGARGFGFAHEAGGRWLPIPQIGHVVIMDDVEIGANSTVDRGTIAATMIKKGAKIDDQVHIGHNVIIGENTIIAGCVGIAGSTEIGDNCQIGGAVGINGHIKITDNVIVTAMSGVNKSILAPGVYSSGLIPIKTYAVWRKNVARFNNLDATLKKIMQQLANK